MKWVEALVLIAPLCASVLGGCDGEHTGAVTSATTTTAAQSTPTVGAPAAQAGGPTAQAGAFYAAHFSKTPSVAAMTDLGRLLFSDPGMSANGKLACATCHVPSRAYGPPDVDVVDLPRAIPSLRYLQTIPPFSEHHFDEAGDESVDQGPTGGHNWDGRADTVHDQARLPLLSPSEMANPSTDAVVDHVERGPYADRFRATFGEQVFSDRALALKGILLSLEVFQQSPADFYPYTSKYDAWLRGKAPLTRVETRGLAVFNDPAKGNCASCHPSQIMEGAFPQFTDYGFIALGVPRNARAAANRDAANFDLGLCGPQRTDLRERAEYCGRFRAPSLRNVALRKRFFHNGVFRELRKAIEFYAERDTHPEKFYPKDGQGHVRKYDDLPPQYRGNVNAEPPFGGHAGGRAVLSTQDVDDLLAFLSTLNDGYAAN